MVDLRYTSVPQWVGRASDETSIPRAEGRSYVLVGVGEEAEEVLRAWRGRLTGAPVTVLTGSSTQDVIEQLRQALGQAHVGVRLWVAASSGATLLVRAAALAEGLSDDEMTFVSIGTGGNTVYCAHCQARTETSAGVEDDVTCSGCGEDLLVYYHVSRRTGEFLGFKVDAENSSAGVSAPVGTSSGKA